MLIKADLLSLVSKILFILFLIMNICECLGMGFAHDRGDLGGQKKVTDPLELEFQVAVCCQA